MLSTCRRQLVMRGVASSRVRQRRSGVALCSSPLLVTGGSVQTSAASFDARAAVAPMPATADKRSVHSSPASYVSAAPRVASREDEPLLPPAYPAVSRPAASATSTHKPPAPKPARAVRVSVDASKKPIPGPPATTIAAAEPPPSLRSIDLAAPVAYQDMGNNKMKLNWYIADPTAALPSADATTVTLPLIDREATQRPNQEDTRPERQKVLDHFVASPALRRLLSPVAGALQHMLPKGYPNSVHAPYTHYTQYAFLGGVSSMVSGVLSMQCMLFAVGLGQPIAVPAAAAVNWILKDGLGQFGGVIFANRISSRFDSDAKRWRMIGSIILDASVLIEMCTPLAPAFFLPMASAANMGKTVTWQAVSASRAAIHKSLCREENLADMTAKSGAQITAASIIGTALGIGVSFLVGTAVIPLLCVFAVTSAVHISSTYVSLKGLPLNTFNDQRAERAILAYCNGGRVPSVNEIRDSEQFFSRYRSPLKTASRLEMNVKLASMVADFESMTPHISPLAPVAVWSSLTSFDRLLLLYREDAFLLTIRPGQHSPQPYIVSLLFLQPATSADVLSAYLLQVRFRLVLKQLLDSRPSSAAVEFSEVCALLQQSVQWLRLNRSLFLRQVAAEGWNTEHLFLESDRLRRVTLLQSRVVDVSVR